MNKRPQIHNILTKEGIVMTLRVYKDAESTAATISVGGTACSLSVDSALQLRDALEVLEP